VRLNSNFCVAYPRWVRIFEKNSALCLELFGSLAIEFRGERLSCWSWELNPQIQGRFAALYFQ